MGMNAVSDGVLPGRLAPATAQLFRETSRFKRSFKKIGALLRTNRGAIRRGGDTPYCPEIIQASDPMRTRPRPRRRSLCHAAVASVETARSRQRASSCATKAFFVSMRRTVSLPNGIRSGGSAASTTVISARASLAGSPG
jgi:hypothetical protein